MELSRKRDLLNRGIGSTVQIRKISQPLKKRIRDDRWVNMSKCPFAEKQHRSIFLFYSQPNHFSRHRYVTYSPLLNCYHHGDDCRNNRIISTISSMIVIIISFIVAIRNMIVTSLRLTVATIA